jgi:hypothetical protein
MVNFCWDINRDEVNEQLSSRLIGLLENCQGYTETGHVEELSFARNTVSLMKLSRTIGENYWGGLLNGIIF